VIALLMKSLNSGIKLYWKYCGKKVIKGRKIKEINHKGLKKIATKKIEIKLEMD
jgi:hypothetical protein